MKAHQHSSGFTIIELMIVVAIIALITAIAYPAYSSYVLKSNRGEAQQLMLAWSVNQEIWRSNNTSYATTTNLPAPNHGKYTFSLPTRSASAYTLRAVAKGSQTKDKEDGTLCTTLELNQSGARSPAICWQ